MRCVSQLFQPLLTIPKNAKIKNTEVTCKSQKLLLECGLVRPAGAGLFTLLPLARRALDKLEALARDAVEGVGAQCVALPSLTSARLWEQTGRLDEVGPELMSVEDRHGKKYLLAPTHEEAVADLLADVGPLSYKQLPLLLYQVSSKFRDEARPKHGLLRAREFIMLDAYGAHASEACARAAYERVARALRRLFARLQLPVHRVEAPPGAMGGALSHEWHVRARAGEDALAMCARCGHAARADGAGSGACARCGGPADTCSTVEVAHTFLLGSRYSAALRAHFVPQEGPPEPLLMSCYGVGLTRLLAASLEALSSDTALRWPRGAAPYGALLVGPKAGSREWESHGWDKVQQVHARLSAAGGLRDDVLVDDRHHLTIGKRLLMADRMGYPLIVVCGRSALESPPRYEVYHSTPDKDLTLTLLTLEELEQHARDFGDLTTAEQED